MFLTLSKERLSIGEDDKTELIAVESGLGKDVQCCAGLHFGRHSGLLCYSEWGLFEKNNDM